MVILVVFNSFNVVKNLKKPNLVARQKPPFYTTDDHVKISLTSQLIKDISEVLQKLLNYFSGTIISTSFVPPFLV